jgi:regulator of nucleoside diphosphate kinase
MLKLIVTGISLTVWGSVFCTFFLFYFLFSLPVLGLYYIEIQSNSRGEQIMARKIFITESDKHKILKIISQTKYDSLKNKEFLNELEEEINRAVVKTPDQLPGDVISMHSKVLLAFGDEEEEYTLVYPEEADISQNRISVLSPIGTAILGYPEGSVIEWKVPDGTVKITVKKILFQPEASGRYDL